MSDLIVLIVGIIVFAITVYGTVMAGGIVFTRRQLEQNPSHSEGINEDTLDQRFPVKVKF